MGGIRETPFMKKLKNTNSKLYGAEKYQQGIAEC